MRLIDKKNQYRYLDHPADILIEAYGADISHACANAVRAACSMITIAASSKVGVRNSKTNVRNHVNAQKKRLKTHRLSLVLEANSSQSLLFECINAILAVVEVKRLWCNRVVSIRVATDRENNNRFSAILVLDVSAIPRSAIVINPIKAPTYHQMEFIENGSRCTIRYVLDV